MKNVTLFRLPLAFLLAILCLVSALPLSAQYVDDPNLDQIPPYLRNRQSKSPGGLPLSTVITVNNYDNFNLAVDFAENNIAENPNIPTWYFTAYNTNAAHNTENGLTWANSSPSFGATMQGDPVVAYDSLGNLFYENMYGSSILGCKVIVSTNNGATWGPSVTAIAGNDKNWIACDQTNGPYANYVYTVMTNNSAGNFARSTDHGVTFQSTFAPTTQSLPGMMVCVGPNANIQGGSVYVVTNSGNSFTPTYTFYRSTDGGATFTQMSTAQWPNTVGTQSGGRNSVQNMRTRPYPMIAADNSYGSSRGRLYCVYAGNDPPGNGNKPDIWSRYSTNGGTTWSAAVLVNDDPNPTTHNQWHPAIWCDKETGRLYAMWMDTRNCPTNDSALIYASYSDNGGVTWAANQAISNQKMKIDCASCGGGGTPRYQGDYNGIVSNKKVAHVAWADFRQGTFMSTTAYFPDFAMALNDVTDSLYAPNDSSDFIVNIPAVKLYSDTVVLSGVISPAPSTGSINFIFPQGNKITTFPGSKTVRLKLTGSVPTGIYQAQFFAKGPNGTPVHQRNASITVLISQTLAISVTANPQTVCSGSSTQLQATITGGILPYTYSWTSTPPGFTSNVANPLASPTVNTWYKCTAHDNVNTIVKDSVFVTVSALPTTPGTITGNTTVCEGGTATYTIAAVPGATSYNWTVPTGSMIQSGQGSVSITVIWGMNSGNVSVASVNSCGNSPASNLAVTVSPLPATPGPINGPNAVCNNTTHDYSVTAVTGLTYNWTVPMDATITSGQGTATVTVQWGLTPGVVSVTAQNTCGASQQPSTLSVAIETIPAPAQTMVGPDTVCQGDGGYQYSIPAISNASSYVWTLPMGASISQGSGTSAVTVNFSSTAVSGQITAAGNNFCGTGTASSLDVTVVVCTGLDNNSLQSSIEIFPNPTHGMLNLSIKGSEKKLQVQILDLTGKSLQKETLENLTSSCTRQIDVNGLAAGIYVIRISSETRLFTQRFTVN
jgi:hypothetical protein